MLFIGVYMIKYILLMKVGLKPERENLLNFSELYNLKKDKSIECYVKIVVEKILRI